MGNKIITENDFFQCSGGMMPSPFQSKQLIVKKADSAKYITKMDISTISWVDFGCKKLMLLYAVVAAVAALVAALCVATGGAALIAICAIAGVVGAAFGAVVGTLICGQLVAPTRQWLGSKSNFKILGIDTITGDHYMRCDAFVMLGMSPEFITFAPNIKSWGQAIAMGSASFLANVLQGALTGMMIGAAGTAIPALFQGGTAALAGGGISQLGRFLGTNLVKNYFASWFTAGGLGIRGAITLQTTLDAYGTTGEVTGADIKNGIFGLELGTAHSAVNIVTGNANVLDIIGLTLWFSPTSQVVRRNVRGNTEAKTENGRVVETKPVKEVKSNETPKKGNAYESVNILKSPKTTFGKIRLAYEYYKSLGWAKEKIRSHMDGIDFSKPVELVELPKGKLLSQYQAPNGKKGNYFAEPNAKASELGINPKAELLDGTIVDKTKTIYQTNDNVIVLRSTAKSGIKDNWSVPSQPPYETTGGGTQYFTQDNTIFVSE